MPAPLRADRGDDVHELGDAGDLHPVGAADELVEQAADEQRVLEVVVLLEQRRRLGPVPGPPLLRVLLAVVVPDVPFVEADVDVVLGPLLGLDVVDDPADRLDVAPGLLDLAEIVERVAARVAEVLVQRDVLDVLVALLEHLPLPFGIGRHRVVGAAADDRLDVLAERLHRLRGLVGEAAVLLRDLVADLPGAIHLVAEAPHPHVVGLLDAVAAAEVAPGGAARVVAVFGEGARGIEVARAEVDREHHLDAGLLRPDRELVDADLVGLLRPPGEVEAHRPLVLRPDAVLPVVGGDEVAARIADRRDLQRLHQLQHVLAETVLVGLGMAGLVDPGVDRPAHVLDEGRVQAVVDRPDPEVPVHGRAHFHSRQSFRVIAEGRGMRRPHDRPTPGGRRRTSLGMRPPYSSRVAWRQRPPARYPTH